MTRSDQAAFCALIVAGGNGSRFGGELPKQFLMLSGTPIIVHTLNKFEMSQVVSRMVLVLPVERCRWFEKTILHNYHFSKLSVIVEGGQSRQASVYRGLTRVDAGEYPFVVIHDGVRPFFNPHWLETGLQALMEVPVVAVGISPVDTIKRVSHRGFSVATLKRESLVMIQTPQMFRTELIREAHEKARKQGLSVTDDTSLMEWFGYPVKILPGSRWNIKITVPEDLKVGEVLLRNNAGLGEAMEGEKS